MTGYESKRAAARDKLEDDDTQVYQDDALTIAYQSGYYDGKKAAQPAQESVAWMSNKDFEPIRVRIMQEAYELADRNDSEGYNAIKAMCGDVQRMLPPQRPWVGLTDEEIDAIYLQHHNQYEECESPNWGYERAIEAALRSKNT